MDEGGSNIRRILESQHGVVGAGGPAWSPDGDTIALGFAGVVTLLGVRDGKLTPLDLGFPRSKLPSWSWDGSRIAFFAVGGGIVRGIYVADSDGGAAELVSPSDETRTSWLPDGSGLLMADRAAFGGVTSDVFKVDIETGKRTNMTDLNAWDYAPTVSPDGASIAFESNRDNVADPLRIHVYAMDIGGAGQHRILEAQDRAAVTGWTYPHQGILYSAVRQDNWDIWTVTRDGRSARRLTTHPALDMDAVMKPGPLPVNPLNLKASVWGFMKRAVVDR